MSLLPVIDVEELSRRLRQPVDVPTLTEAAAIVEAVRTGGSDSLRKTAEDLGDIDPGAPLVVERPELEAAYRDLSGDDRDLLSRIHTRIRRFAEAQRAALSDFAIGVDGGEAGQRWVPVHAVGAYSPGGRHPLPSTVLMTVTPARVAGVESVWVASPRPPQITLAAAWVAGADGLIPIGGAQAIAAFAFGTITPPCDLIVGPGNRWVTAAKKHLYGEVGIDGLAGPSEILVIADETAEPARVAADLLAQAEHDVDAVPMLVATDPALIAAVMTQLDAQLEDLPTAAVARRALGNGFAVVVANEQEAIEVSERIAPEHLALHVVDPLATARSVRSYGSVFIGDDTAEAFADYGAGPNHVLPTGGTARHSSGLSVATFLRSATWLAVNRPQELEADTVALARHEGLEAHARASTRAARSPRSTG